MHILLFIFLYIIAIVIFGLSIVGFLLRSIFGIGRHSSSPHSGQSGRHADRQDNRESRHFNNNDDEEEIFTENVPARKHKKIFTKEDGEYVDFEEIKE